MNSPIQSTAISIDHVGLVGNDIAALIAAYERLGFTVSAPKPLMQPAPDGKGDAPMGQVVAHALFPDTYIELTAVRHHGQGNHLDNWISRHEGLHVLAFRADDVAVSWRDMVNAGVVLGPLREANRQVKAGKTIGTARFKWFEIPDSIAREGFVCAVQHLTPELAFPPSMPDHPNGAVGLRSVTMVVTDMDEAFARYNRLPGTVKRSFAIGRIIALKDQRLVVLEPKGLSALYPGAAQYKPPYLAAYAIAVKDIAATKDYLTQAGIPFNIWGTEGVWVDPAHTGGAILAFIDKSAPI